MTKLLDGRATRDAERFKNELEIQKQKFQNEADLAAQRIAAELQVATHRDQTATTFLLERCFEAVTSVYNSLVDLRMELDALASIKNADDKTRVAETLARLSEKLPGLFRALKTSRIWFDRDTCASLDLVGTITAASLLHSTHDMAKASDMSHDTTSQIESEYFAFAADKSGIAIDDVHEISRTRFRPLLDKTLSKIEGQLRALIGTPDSTDREPPSVKDQIRAITAPSKPTNSS